MKRLRTKWTSLSLVLALLISLLPPVSAYAVASLEIKNLYTGTANPGTSSEKPLDDSQVTRITSLPLTVTVDIPGVTSSQISSLYYVVTNINSGAEIPEKNNKAQAKNANQVDFKNVQLTEGLNKIVVMLGDTDAVTSAPGWVYYAPTTNLSDITVNNAPLVNGTIYPVNRAPLKAGTTGIQIKAKAPNSKSVQATIVGDTVPKDGFPSNDGYVYFAGDDKTKSSTVCSSTSSFCLTPGDNRITFNANNDTNKYEITKNIWYDNGQPFAFNGKIGVTAITPNYQELIDVPTFKQPTLTLSASLKADYDSSGSVTKYTYAEISINGTLVTGPIYFGTNSSGTSIASYTVSKNDILTRSNEYAVSDVVMQVDMSANGIAKANPQVLTYTFKDSTGALQPITSVYKFNYVDPSQPYIDKVTQVTGGTVENQLSVSDSNGINELPATFYIYTNDKTKSIRTYLDGSAYPAADNLFDATIPADATSYTMPDGTPGYRYTLTLQGISDGNKKLRVDPHSDPGGTSIPNGATTKQYDLNINNAPYITINGISNGMSVKTLNALKCDTTIACISGRVINYYQDVVPSPGNSLNKIEVYINEKVFRLDDKTGNDGAGNPIFNAATKEFKIPLSSFGTLASVMSEGKNTLKFKVFLNGAFITEQSYDIYLFSTDAPQFISIKPFESGATGTTQYIVGSNPNMYTTTQHTVSLAGAFSSLTGNTPTIKALTLIVHTKDAKGNALIQQETIGAGGTRIDGDSDLSATIADSSTTYFPTFNLTAQTFQTSKIKLPETGDVIFEFRITNGSNITATKSITVTRQNVPYIIRQPILINNGSNLQANINSNFYTVKIEAEHADNVIFGKDSAGKQTVTENGVQVDIYSYDVKNLKPGKNQINFTVNRGAQKSNGTLTLVYTNSDTQGAQFLAAMNSKLSVFNANVQLSFPKDTMLMRNKPDTNNNQYITSDRDILFAIADSDDGRLDKSLYPSDGYFKSLIGQKIPDNTFRPASNLYYMDAGFIPPPSSSTTTQGDLQSGLKGRGLDPYDKSVSGRAYFYRNQDEMVVPTKDGTLTLKFDPYIRQDSGKYVSVFFYDTFANYFDQTDRGWKVLGGTVNTSNNTITVPFDKFGYYQVMYMDKTFNDITGHQFARNELETLYSKGVMKAITPFTFAPDNSITRAEFAQMLVKMFKIPLNYDGQNTFQDVLKMDYGLYDYKYIETAARIGIVRGQASNRFNPGGSITRQDAAIMIARAANLKLNPDPVKSLPSLQKTFTDGDNIDYYARTAVEAVTKAGFIEGVPNAPTPGQKKTTNRFDSTELLTRAQASVIAYRVMKQQKLVP